MDLFLLLALTAATAASRPDPRALVERSIAANEADWKAAYRYSYVEREEESHLGPHGNVKSRTVKTYRVSRINGAPYRRLIARDDRPLSPDEDRKEQEKWEKARTDTGAEDDKKGQNGQNQDVETLLHEMLNAFEFKLVGLSHIWFTPVYVVELTPRPGYEPPNPRAKALTKMHGRLWIHRRTFQWLRAEAEVMEPVTFYAFLGRLDPGTRIEFEQSRIENRAWLPTRLHLKINAKVMMVKDRCRDVERTYKYQRPEG